MAKINDIKMCGHKQFYRLTRDMFIRIVKYNPFLLDTPIHSLNNFFIIDSAFSKHSTIST